MSEPTNPTGRPHEGAPAPEPSRASDPAHDDPSVGPDAPGTVPPTHDGPPEHPDVRYETTDVSFRAILYTLLSAAGVGAVVFVAVGFFFRGYRDREAKVKRSTFPLADAPSTARPRAPRLEQIDRLDGARTTSAYELEADKLKTLNSYGPTDDKGFVRVPIGQAMKSLAGKLPARAEPTAEQKRRAGGLVGAGEPNAGRMFRRGAK